MRRYPRVNGPAVLPLFCLAPHGVFRASQIAPRAVSSYLAFSPLPDLRCQRTGGVFSVTLSVTAILQPRRPRVFRGMLPYGVRTFLWRALRSTSDHLPSRGSYHGLGTKERRDRSSNKRPTTGYSKQILCVLLGETMATRVRVNFAPMVTERPFEKPEITWKIA
jgi:hypothetical protein